MRGDLIVLLVGSLLLGAYGILNLISPRLTMRWQQTFTSNARESGHTLSANIGEFLDAWVRGGSTEPSRRVRIIGLIESTIAIGLIVFALATA